MRIIKRYANRKLYDTETSGYVTLPEILEIVKSGASLQVLDHESGKDFTNITLKNAMLHATISTGKLESILRGE